MERASAARAKRMSNNEKTFDVVDTKTGEVTLNHKNKIRSARSSVG